LPAAAPPTTDNVPRRSSPAEQSIFAPAKLETVSKFRLFESPRTVKRFSVNTQSPKTPTKEVPIERAYDFSFAKKADSELTQAGWKPQISI